MTSMMGGKRALFASVGAGISLVAAAAFALLAVSAVFAFGGSAGGLRFSGQSDLVLDAHATSGRGVASAGPAGAAAKPVVIRAPARAPAARARRLSPAKPAPASIAKPEARAAVRPVVRRPAAVVETPPPAPPPAVATVKPRTGDAVRRVGSDLSSTVETTGAKLSAVTAPLGPPVSAAVQKVLDKIAEALKRATDGLGGTLDKVLPKHP